MAVAQMCHPNGSKTMPGEKLVTGGTQVFVKPEDFGLDRRIIGKSGPGRGHKTL